MTLVQTPRDKEAEHKRIAETLPTKPKKAKKPEKSKSMRKLSTTWIIVITVAVTITVAAAFAVVFYQGTQFQLRIDNQMIEQYKHTAQLKQ